MVEYVMAPEPPASVAVVGERARFPVRRIFCVGRNYAAHAREMGQDPDREPPFFFTKPASALVAGDAEIPYPPETAQFHFEAELVVAIGTEAIACPVDQARDCVYGVAIGNDLTRRDLQSRAKDKGQPWDWGKGFDHSAVCGPIHPLATVGPLTHGRIELRLNGEIKQQGDLSELIWSIDEVISIISHSMALRPGDLIYTGTPAGVGAMQVGDLIQITVEGLGVIEHRIVAPDPRFRTAD
ncbi:MAG: FAA hydrolase family protein [Gammaproteobacteria bacterium]|nr:FAA hydrolase family protein [Gammaproteobacteria bacterium]